jgi:FlaA1/EpsC-like NDP-sugar epimerase
MMKSAKNLVKDKLLNIFVFVIADFLVLSVSSLFALWIRFDFSDIPEQYLSNAYNYFVFDFIILFIVFLILKLYTSVWKYASVYPLQDRSWH